MPPCPQYLLHVVERSKLVHVKVLVAQSSVERFDHPVLGRLARADEVEFHAAQVTLLVERLGGKFRSVVDSYRER